MHYLYFVLIWYCIIILQSTTAAVASTGNSCSETGITEHISGFISNIINDVNVVMALFNRLQSTMVIQITIDCFKCIRSFSVLSHCNVWGNLRRTNASLTCKLLLLLWPRKRGPFKDLCHLSHATVKRSPQPKRI